MLTKTSHFDDKYWGWAAGLLTGFVLLLVITDVTVWHPGYAYGDENAIVSYVQRLREGMPFGADLGQGCVHRVLLWFSMSLWPGSLWATSVPAMAGLVVEALLLFVIGNRLGGSRVGFFAVFAGLVSAFTLVRSRVGMSLSLFPAEWLLLVWLRLSLTKPWQWVLWGMVLGLFCFDYEAWMPSAILFMILPFPQQLPIRRRAWELLGLILILLLIVNPAYFNHYLARRYSASLANPGSKSAGWVGLRDIVIGGPTLGYLVPLGHGAIPLWYWLFFPWGLTCWRYLKRIPLSYLALGLALPLMGGAPYGLPAHRCIAAWPVIALVTAFGLDRCYRGCAKNWTKTIFVVGVLSIATQQLLAWQSSQSIIDLPFRGRTRDLKRAADVAWDLSVQKHVPLVTELHPLLGAQFRYLTGQRVPMPDPQAASVVIFLPRGYFSAVRYQKVEVITFQEAAGSSPVMVAYLNGKLAKEVLEAESNIRPILTQAPVYSIRSREKMSEWIIRNPKAGLWARSLANDYAVEAAFHSVQLTRAWLLDVYKQPLVTASPLMIGVTCLESNEPLLALEFAKRARAIDPFNAGTWAAERRLLVHVGKPQDVESLDRARQPYIDHDLLFLD